MPNQTSNNQFNTFLESDAVDWSLINENFEKIDKMVLCVDSGEKTAAYSGGATGNASWKYKKYSDGSVEMYTAIDFDSLKCSGGAKAPYNTDSVRLVFPFQLVSIDCVQMHLISSNTNGWVSDITGRNILDYLLFRVMGMETESSNVYKRVCIDLKGWWK